MAFLGEQKPVLVAIVDFVFPSAYADITGLEPVEGATVELIRVDNTGTQVGDVLASTATSITGDYTLTVPAGTDLSGDLIVRISGMGGAEMRAQVVNQEVNINPVSEFVLQKFIDNGADLNALTTESVVKLVGQVEEFDLTAGADMEAMLAALEAETGNFVEDQISVIESTPGSGATIAGNYRGAEFGFGLHDDDQQYGVGTLSVDGALFEFALSDESNGNVGLTFSMEEDYWSNQTFFESGSTVTLSFDAEIDTETGGSETAIIDDAGVLSVESEFEEEIDGDFGWRSPASVLRLQKALNTNVFVGTAVDASVRYQTVDTNDDQIKDAVNPNAREGDEVSRSLLLVAEKPDAMATSDLSGDFGRVYYEALVNSNGFANVRVEHGTLNFDGAGSLDVNEMAIADLSRSGYSESVDEAAADLAYSVSGNGSVFTVEGGDENSVFNNTFDFLVIHTADATDDANPEDNVVNEVQSGTTLAVKLPGSQLNISNKVYRIFFMGLSLAQDSTSLATTRFDSTMTVSNDGLAASVTTEILDVAKATSTAEVVAGDDEPETQNATISLAANGETSIVVNDLEGATTLNGYFSHDGSLGIFESRYADTGADPDELGIVVLVEIAGE